VRVLVLCKFKRYPSSEYPVCQRWMAGRAPVARPEHSSHSCTYHLRRRADYNWTATTSLKSLSPTRHRSQAIYQRVLSDVGRRTCWWWKTVELNVGAVDLIGSSDVAQLLLCSGPTAAALVDTLIVWCSIRDCRTQLGLNSSN